MRILNLRRLCAAGKSFFRLPSFGSERTTGLVTLSATIGRLFDLEAPYKTKMAKTERLTVAQNPGGLVPISECFIGRFHVSPFEGLGV
jgi:hypothetical protein